MRVTLALAALLLSLGSSSYGQDAGAGAGFNGAKNQACNVIAVRRAADQGRAPDLVGCPADWAEKALTLFIGHKVTISPPGASPRGVPVVDQSPAAGDQVVDGETFTLSVDTTTTTTTPATNASGANKVGGGDGGDTHSTGNEIVHPPPEPPQPPNLGDVWTAFLVWVKHDNRLVYLGGATLLAVAAGVSLAHRRPVKLPGAPAVHCEVHLEPMVDLTWSKPKEAVLQAPILEARWVAGEVIASPISIIAERTGP